MGLPTTHHDARGFVVSRKIASACSWGTTQLYALHFCAACIFLRTHANPQTRQQFQVQTNSEGDSAFSRVAAVRGSESQRSAMAAVASLSDDDASSMATTVPGAVVVVIDDETDVFESAPDIESPKSQVFESNPDMYPDTFPDTAMQDNVMLSNVDGVFKEESMSISDTLLETALQDVFVLSMVDDALKEESMNIPDTFLDTARPDNGVPSMVEEALKEESPSIPDIVRQDEVALGESLSIDSYSAAWLRRDNDVTQSEAFPDFINKHYNPNPHRSRSPDRYYLKHGPAASLSAAPASARFPFDIHRFENLGKLAGMRWLDVPGTEREICAPCWTEPCRTTMH